MLNVRAPLGRRYLPGAASYEVDRLCCPLAAEIARWRTLAFDRATRAVRALSDQQSARSTSPLGSSEHKLKRGAASLPRFWIERPKAWLLRHTAGTDRILTLPPPDNAPRRINAFFFSASAWRVGGLPRHAACDSSALRGRPRPLFLFDPFWTKMPWCLAGTAQPLT